MNRYENVNLEKHSSQARGGEPILYHGPHVLWNITSDPQNVSNLVYDKKCDELHQNLGTRVKLSERGPKLFEVIWCLIVLCLHIKIAELPPFGTFAHNFCNNLKTYDLLQSLLIVALERFMQKVSAKRPKGGVRRPPRLPPIIPTPACITNNFISIQPTS